MEPCSQQKLGIASGISKFFTTLAERARSHPYVRLEVYPLLGIVSVALTGVAAFSVYALATKNDVMINHHKPLPPWEREEVMDTTKPKLLNLHPIPKMRPDIRNLKEEINHAFIEEEAHHHDR